LLAVKRENEVILIFFVGGGFGWGLVWFGLAPVGFEIWRRLGAAGWGFGAAG
jgi:hypothetical protein